MTAARSCTEEIVKLERLAYVILWRNPKVAEEILDCLLSPVMQCTDPQLAPMYDAINSRCCKRTHQETLPDEYMIFGEVEHTSYLMYTSCPGDAVTHLCIEQKWNDRDEERWLSTDRYRR